MSDRSNRTAHMPTPLQRLIATAIASASFVWLTASVSGQEPLAKADRAEALRQRYVESRHVGRTFDPPVVPSTEDLAKELLPALEPCMAAQGYAPAEIQSLAETAAKVIRLQLVGSFDAYEKFIGELGGKHKARSGSPELRERAVKEAKEAWRGADAANAPRRIVLADLSARAYDRQLAGARISSEILPEGRAFHVAFSRFDWGVDIDKCEQGPCDVVDIRMPIRDGNGLESHGTLTYLRHPVSRKWIPYQVTVTHAVGRPYVQINF